MNLVQETDPGLTASLPVIPMQFPTPDYGTSGYNAPSIDDISRRLRSAGTVGSVIHAHFVPLSGRRNYIDEALQVVLRVEDSRIARDAENILRTFESVLSSHYSPSAGLRQFPPIHAFMVEDGSVLLEWIFPNFRIGFNVEPAAEESSWYLVSKLELDHINASGYLGQADHERLVRWLVAFALAYS